MEKAQQYALLRFFKAVGQKERLQIIGLLADRTHTLPELSAALQEKEVSLLRHLAQLRQAGLILEEGQGATATYRLSSAGLADFQRLILENEAPEHPEEVVLQRFTRDGQLVEMPGDPAEQETILRWLADKFEPGRRYSESAVEAIIYRFYPQSTGVSTMLVEHGLLQRDGQIYWRPEGGLGNGGN